MIALALLLAGTAVAAPMPAAQPVAATSLAPAPVDFSGLWVISKRTRMGPLDDKLEPIKGDIYTAKAAAARAKVRPALDPSVMCLPSMPRHLSGPYPIQIVQSGGKLALLFEWDTVFRLVHLGSTAHPDPEVETRWMGHSIGRWEGTTLVVDTANFNGKAWLAGDGTPLSAAARLTEWFSLSDAGKTLNIKMKIEDPDNLTRPIWRDYVFNLRNDWEIKEYVCAEGNRDNVFAPGAGAGSLEKDDVLGK
jgi:hypothetical protein